MSHTELRSFQKCVILENKGDQTESRRVAQFSNALEPVAVNSKKHSKEGWLDEWRETVVD